MSASVTIPHVLYALCDKALRQIRTNPCESPRIRTNPYQKRARIRRESASLIIWHPFFLAQYVAQISPIVVHCFTILPISIMDNARLCPQCGLDSERTQKGRLPPWEVRDAPLVPGRMPALSSRGGSRDLMMAAFAETNITCTYPGAHATSRFESN